MDTVSLGFFSNKQRNKKKKKGKKKQNTYTTGRNTLLTRWHATNYNKQSMSSLHLTRYTRNLNVYIFMLRDIENNNVAN